MSDEDELVPVQAVICAPSAEPTLLIKWVVPELDNLQRIVGGYIEGRKFPNFYAYLNDEGKLTGLPSNPFANTIFEHYFPGFLKVDHIVGTVVFFGTYGPAEASIPVEVLFNLVKLMHKNPNNAAHVAFAEKVVLEAAEARTDFNSKPILVGLV